MSKTRRTQARHRATCVSQVSRESRRELFLDPMVLARRSQARHRVTIAFSRCHQECSSHRTSRLINVKENHRNTFGKFDSTNFPTNAATWCIFACYCMWASFQMSGIVQTYTRRCQNSSLSNTQDILNIFIGTR